MPIKKLISLIFLVGMAGCAGGGGAASDLSLGCQLKPCVCAEDGALFDADTTEMLWHDDGRAYCPEGFHLEATGEES